MDPIRGSGCSSNLSCASLSRRLLLLLGSKLRLLAAIGIGMTIGNMLQLRLGRAEFVRWSRIARLRLSGGIFTAGNVAGGGDTTAGTRSRWGSGGRAEPSLGRPVFGSIVLKAFHKGPQILSVQQSLDTWLVVFFVMRIATDLVSR